MRRLATAEYQRLEASRKREADWKNWGPYVADRAWGTVREHYGPGNQPWVSFPHEQARYRAYRWNEDGIGGFCNRFQNVCMALALWNEQDPFLKERFFGLSGPEGNHGEDVKEYYFHQDGTPTHSYMAMLYRYPHAAYPYEDLVEEAGRRSRSDMEYELVDALREEFVRNRFFDVRIEWAKADEEDMLCRITATNQGDREAPLHLLPHIWYRNTWSWGDSRRAKPTMRRESEAAVRLQHHHLGERFWYVRSDRASVKLLFTENETNQERLNGRPNASAYTKDGIDQAIVHGDTDTLNPEQTGTKCAAHLSCTLSPGESWSVETRFCREPQDRPFAESSELFRRRKAEADEFYEAVHPEGLTAERKAIQRKAWAGLTWSKQFYHYSVELWEKGDPEGPTSNPPPRIRNGHWRHLYNVDVIAMPDKWEYPWYAVWDTAFHTVALAHIDQEWAKRQLILVLREWYMHPNGQLPAYEWSFSDVNPPVHAWAARRVYNIDRDIHGKGDLEFLERVFHKLLLNFTWWVNRKDRSGNNIFEGGFLGLDNIGVFDRSAELPSGGYLEQSDGTAWMGAYCLNMLAIALELARHKPAYEDVATKFFEHFIYIANAINSDDGLWNDADGFFYDRLHTPDGKITQLQVKSFVGLTPLFAVETFSAEILKELPRFRRRVQWFLKYRPHWLTGIAPVLEPGQNERHLLALVPRERLERLLSRMLNEDQFLGEFGLRSMSKEHLSKPFELQLEGKIQTVGYEPAESASPLFGGNSNWRGPIWFPLNFLMIETLRKLHRYYGDSVQIESPVGSGRKVNLGQASRDVSDRLIRLFEQDAKGRRPFLGGETIFDDHPLWKDELLFYEYFHGDNGAGIGASHQTGWTALVANLIHHCAGEM